MEAKLTKGELEQRIESARRCLEAAAFILFDSNPHWHRRYAEAPAGARRFLRQSFVSGLYDQIKVSDEQWREVTAGMTPDDWRYLADRGGDTQSVNPFAELVD